MLTPFEIRTQLDAFANEILQLPGLYYELFSRLFSERVQRWIHTAPQADAALIRRVAEHDPDYSVDISAAPHTQAKQSPIFNPAWDVDY